MTESPFSCAFAITLLGPIDDARHILRRLQNNEAFQHYLRRRTLRALRSSWGFCLQVSRVPQQRCSLLSRRYLLVLAATIVVAPIVLIAVFRYRRTCSVLARGAFAREASEHHRLVTAGRSANARAELSHRHGPLPQVPWIPALVFFLVPPQCWPSRGAVGRGLAAFRLLRDLLRQTDPVHVPSFSARAGSRHASLSRQLLCGAAGSKQAGDLDFASPRPDRAPEAGPAPSFFVQSAPLPSFPG